MCDFEQLHAIEHAFAFHYPEWFWNSVEELSKIAVMPRFSENFHQMRTATGDDFKTMQELGAPVELLPFACEPDPEFPAYYCLSRQDNSVAVFRIHAVVAQWPTFEEFIEWVRQQCQQ